MHLSGGWELCSCIRGSDVYCFAWLAQLVLEPGGAAGLAALLAGKVDVKGKTVGVIASVRDSIL